MQHPSSATVLTKEGQKSMRRLLTSGLLLVAALLFAACTSSGHQATDSLPGRWAAAHSSSATPTPPPYQAPHIEGATAVIDRVTVMVSHKTPIMTPNFLGTGFQVVARNDSGAEQTVAVGDVQQVVPNASSLAFPDLVRFPGLSTRSVPVRVGAQQQDLDVVPLTPIPRP